MSHTVIVGGKTVSIVHPNSSTQLPPSFSQTNKLTASDATAGKSFGVVAISGSTMVIGADSDDSLGTNRGAAYVFEESGGVWSQVKKIRASDAQDNDHFGYRVAIDGNVIVIGTLNSNATTGTAYVFEKSGTWPTTETKIITASDVTSTDSYGSAVAVSGTTIIVGANNKNFTTGAAYIYKKAGSWPATESQKLVASDAQSGDRFGYSVGIDGTSLVVGARDEDGGSGDLISDAGAAYVFEDTGTWTEQKIITASDAQASDWFGGSVSISGTTIIVGAILEDGGIGNPLNAAGAAYIYEKSGTWPANETQKIVSSDLQSADFFGGNVSISGTTLVVGANSEDGGAGDPLNGAAYVFEESGGTWTETKKLASLDLQAGDSFGGSVSVNGTNIAVSATQEDGGSGDPLSNAGAVYVFTK